MESFEEANVDINILRVRWDVILWAIVSLLYNVRRLNTLLSVQREVDKNVGKGNP